VRRKPPAGRDVLGKMKSLSSMVRVPRKTKPWAQAGLNWFPFTLKGTGAGALRFSFLGKDRALDV